MLLEWMAFHFQSYNKHKSKPTIHELPEETLPSLNTIPQVVSLADPWGTFTPPIRRSISHVSHTMKVAFLKYPRFDVNTFQLFDICLTVHH